MNGVSPATATATAAARGRSKIVDEDSIVNSMPIEVMTEDDIISEINVLETALKKEYEKELQRIDNDAIDREMSMIEKEIELTTARLLDDHQQISTSEKVCAKCLKPIDMTKANTYIQCGDCQLLYHGECLDMNEIEIQCVEAFECGIHNEGEVLIQWKKDFMDIIDISATDAENMSAEQLTRHLEMTEHLIKKIQKYQERQRQQRALAQEANERDNAKKTLKVVSHKKKKR